MLGWELPPHNSGGLGVACLQLCRALSKRNLDIKFVVPYATSMQTDFMHVISATPHSPHVLLGAYESAGYKDSGTDNVPQNIFQLEQQYLTSIESIAKGSSYDVIHSHDWLTFRAALRAKAILGKPFIAHVHSLESDRAGNKIGNTLVHEIEYMGLMNADHIVAVSGFTKDKIVADYGIPADKISVAHNSIDPTAIVPADPFNSYDYLEQMKLRGYKVVVNVGRLTVQKGLHNYLDACARVVNAQPKTLFLIVGSGELEHELIAKSAELGIGRNVLFAGFQRGKRWRDAFVIADLFVLPSLSEPFGLTPLEAIAYGTPSIVSKQSGVAEVFKNCLKVDNWDTEKMASSIVSMLRHQNLADEITLNALAEFETMNWDKTAEMLGKLYEHHASKVAA